MALKTRVFILTGLLCSAIFASCNFPLVKSNGVIEETEGVMSDVEILATTVAQTLSSFEAQIEQQATTVPEATAQPTATPSDETDGQSMNNQPMAQSYSYAASACYAASTVSETIYDNTVMDPDEDFTKTWTLLNSGTCSWYSGYELVYISGYQMDGDSPQYISSEISPGESVTFSVDMEAPSSEGTYTGNWELQTADGTTIASIWVKIIVDEDDDDDFEVSSVTFSTDETYTGTCPYTYTYKAYITSDGEGDVVYYFKYSDGSTSSASTLAFDEDETRTVSGSWTLSSSGDYWVKVYIQSPNNQTFGKAELDLNCTSPTAIPTTKPTTAPTAMPTSTTAPTATTAVKTDGDTAGSDDTSTG